MKKRTSLLLALSLLFAVGITSCSNDGDSGPPAKNKPVEEVTPDEAVSVSEYVAKSEFQASQSVLSEQCRLEGVGRAAYAFFANPNTPDSELAAICSSTQDACQQTNKQDTSDDYTDSCELMDWDFLQGCSATVDEVTRCYKAILNLEVKYVKQQAAEVPKCSQITSAWLVEMMGNSPMMNAEPEHFEIPATCDAFANKCPEMFADLILEDWDDDWDDKNGEDWNDDKSED